MSKVAVVTGAGAGIGAACARRFAQEGWCVVVADIDAQAANDACAAIEEGDGAAIACVGDVSDRAFCESTASAAHERWGAVDVLVANAGVQTGGSLFDATDDDWARVIDVNLKGVAHACTAVLPGMVSQGSGSIVIISSINAVRGSAGMPIYDASKAGVLGLMRSLAVEHGAHGVRVNAVCPGNTITDHHINRLAEEGITVEQIREMARGYGLLGRAAEPEEIASAVWFLASKPTV